MRCGQLPVHMSFLNVLQELGALLLSPMGEGGGPDVSGLICYNIASVLPFGVLASWHVGSSLFNQ